MAMPLLTVWRDVSGGPERVGSIEATETGLLFSYEDGYAGPAISLSMPVRPGAFDENVSTGFFDALLPEGRPRREVLDRLRSDKADISAMLKALGNESVGALLLSVDGDEPYRNPAYNPIDESLFLDLANRPLATSSRILIEAHLSLAGAMAKVGLFKDEGTGQWFQPTGGAPSSHIVKAGNVDRFPNQVENEAICMGAAKRVGLRVADVEVIGDPERPLLTVARFDRVSGRGRTVTGMKAPMRLHQEDFLQATSLPGYCKYEVTGHPNLEVMACAVDDFSSDPMNDRQTLFAYTVFNYLVGNCDNHLKNHSFLYDEEWSSPRVSPLYDVCSTTVYPDLAREMGTSFSKSRRVDDIDRDAILSMAKLIRVPQRVATKTLSELATAVPDALSDATESLEESGFYGAASIGREIVHEAKARAQAIST